jgi:hypothetical protein
MPASTRLTVAVETPARLATSRMVGGLVRLVIGLVHERVAVIDCIVEWVARTVKTGRPLRRSGTGMIIVRMANIDEIDH